MNLTSVKSTSSRKATLKWKKVSDADGYQIIYSTKKSFSGKKSILISKSKTNRTITKLQRSKTYYFKVRAYKKDGSKKVYGSYSNVRKVKIKK